LAGRRGKLLDLAERILATPNTELKASAPRFATIEVPKDMLGKVIGPQGSNVRSIERDTNCRVTIDQVSACEAAHCSQSLLHQREARRCG
jgi:polyribonucleotide nucleotidyltransferase